VLFLFRVRFHHRLLFHVYVWHALV
jgi:hypothetical protein